MMNTKDLTHSRAGESEDECERDSEVSPADVVESCCKHEYSSLFHVEFVDELATPE